MSLRRYVAFKELLTVFCLGVLSIAKVLDTVTKPLEVQTVSTSARKLSDKLDSSSVATDISASTWTMGSSLTSLTLSVGTEHENPDEAYILLDECFSRPENVPHLGPSSPVNAPTVRSVTPSSAEYMNLPSSGGRKTPDDPMPRRTPGGDDVHARRSLDGAFEGVPGIAEPESGYTSDAGTVDSYSAADATNPLLSGHSKSSNGEIAPALPAKVGLSVVPDVEYDIPRGSVSHQTPSPMHGSPAAPAPRPHMAFPGPMHRYMNTAPVPVRNPTQSSVESLSAVQGAHYRQPPEQAAPRSSPLLPPRAHG